MILKVLVLPLPPLHPVSKIILSPFFNKPLAAPTFKARSTRDSTSDTHSSPSTKPFTLGSVINKGNKPYHKCNCLAAISFLVTAMIGQRGLYFDINFADL